jgi:hypothetical protein
VNVVPRHLVRLCVLALVPLAPAAASAQAPAGGTEFVEDVSYGPDGSRLEAGRSHLLGDDLVRVAGTVASVAPGGSVVVQVLDRRTGWTAAVTTAVGPDGAFEAFWKPARSGRTLVRAVPASAPPEAQASAAGPTRPLTVFRPAVATWYGPGLYGRRTACGQRMTKRLLGVAHKKLRCGTKVDLLHEGRTITVPVVDRGPFRKGTSWDLTYATAKRLAFTSTGTIGAVSVRP